MATKEADIRGGYANLCDCCDSPNCGSVSVRVLRSVSPILRVRRNVLAGVLSAALMYITTITL